VETRRNLPDTLGELLALERQGERVWWWLNGAPHAVAQVQAEVAVGNLKCFREMQAQVRTIDRRRVEIALRIAGLEVAESVRHLGADCRPAFLAPHQPEHVMEVSWLKQSEPARSE
jgi:hypothetical protein